MDFQTIWNYVIKVLSTTSLQILILFGPLFLLSIVMNFVSGLSEKYGIRTFTAKVYLWIFGWIGTTIHELSHALFAILFLHKIDEIKLFSVNEKAETLGYVKHSYNKKSFYQKIGNFFIGLAPIIVGTLFLQIIILLLYQKSATDISHFYVTIKSFTTANGVENLAMDLKAAFVDFFRFIVEQHRIDRWKIVILGYLLFAVGGSIRLSLSDIKSATLGFVTIISAMLLFNVAILWKIDIITPAAASLLRTLSNFYFLMFLAILINLIFSFFLFIAYIFKQSLSK